MKPLSIAGNPYGMLSQMLWGDAIYVRDLFELRNYSQRQLLSALQAHKGWAAATASGKQAMSATINQLLLLREIERSGSGWGPLVAFDRLPERVAARLRRRAAAQLAKLSAAHEALCVQFKQMRFAAEQLRQLQDTLVNAAPPGVAQPPAEGPHPRTG